MRQLVAIALTFGLLGASAAMAAPSVTTDLKVTVTSDRPLAGPYSRAAGWPAVNSIGPAQVSDMNFFYAPGMGPKCDFVRFRRGVDGRLVRSCE